MSKHKIICGDIIPTLKSLPDEHVDMLMTSVPYCKRQCRELVTMTDKVILPAITIYTPKTNKLLVTMTFVKGVRASPETEFKKGYTWREPKPYWDKAWLYMEYRGKDKSAKQIADEQGCNENNILYFLKKHGIKTKTMVEIRAKKFWGLSGKTNGMYGRNGDTNPHWKGGVTPERQAFYVSHEWAEACLFVWNRDMATCQRCGKRKTHNDEEFHIHHIISFSQKEIRGEPNNLVLLCGGCHRWVHSNKNKEKEFLGGDEYSNA